MLTQDHDLAESRACCADASRGSREALHPDELAQLLQAYTPNTTAEHWFHNPAERPSQDRVRDQPHRHSSPQHQMREETSQQWPRHTEQSGPLPSEDKPQQQQQRQQLFVGPSEQHEQAAGVDTRSKPRVSGLQDMHTGLHSDMGRDHSNRTIGPIDWEVQLRGSDGVTPTDLSLAMPICAPPVGPGLVSGSMSSDQWPSGKAGPGGDGEDGSETSSLARSVGGWLAAHVAACIIASGRNDGHTDIHGPFTDQSGLGTSLDQQSRRHTSDIAQQPPHPLQSLPEPPAESEPLSQQGQQQLQSLPEASEAGTDRADEAQAAAIARSIMCAGELPAAATDPASSMLVGLMDKEGTDGSDLAVQVARLVDQVSLEGRPLHG